MQSTPTKLPNAVRRRCRAAEPACSEMPMAILPCCSPSLIKQLAGRFRLFLPISFFRSRGISRRMAADTQLAGCSTMSCIVWLMLGKWPHDITQKDARQNNGRRTECRFVGYVKKSCYCRLCEPPQRFDRTGTM